MNERAETDALHDPADLDGQPLRGSILHCHRTHDSLASDMMRVIALLLLGAAATVGCGRPAGPPAGPVTLVVSLNGDPGALNPAVTTSGNTHPVTDQIFNGLVGLDENLSPVPELAESWAIEDDGRAYRFALRRGVTWHDGAPFTAADVKFTFEEALLKYHSRTRAALQDLVERIETPDDHTVVFLLRRAYSPLLQRLDVVEAWGRLCFSGTRSLVNYPG